MSPYKFESDLVADMKRAAEAMGAVLEVAGQRNAKKSGSDRGLPDCFLAAGGQYIPIEVKRPESTDTRRGRFSNDQLAAAERRRGCGVETYSPTDLSEFVHLANWARCKGQGRCRACPTVPPLSK